MNQITKRNRLLEQLQSYAAFLPICPDDDCQKLIDEMIRIKENISKIKQMTLAELTQQVPEYVNEFQSKANLMKDDFFIEQRKYG